MESQEFSAKKQRVRTAVEAFLRQKFADYPDTEVCRAAQYAVLGAGHRWRAIVAVAAGEIFAADALEITLPGACGTELAHAASLILDDLPSMDDAAIRRGKAAAHHVFPGWAIDMTPVFLVTMAYEISLNNERVSEERRVGAAKELSHAGLKMIAGQVADILQHHGSDEGGLLDIYGLKSGALYAASGKAGAILCGARQADADIIYKACMYLGLSYQFMDDIADVIAEVGEVGKEPGKDANKFTSVDLYGIDGARRESTEFQQRALSLLEGFDAQADWLRTLVVEAPWKAA